MKRVLSLTDAFLPNIGGVEVLTARFNEAMADRGYEIALVTGRTDDDSPDDEILGQVRVLRFPFTQALLERRIDEIARVTSRLRKFYAEFQPDLFHLSPSGPSLYYHYRAAPPRRIPTIAAIHLAIPERREQEGILSGQLLRASDWITANSNEMLAYTRSLVPEIEDRSSVIYYGRQVPEVQPTPLPFDEPRILCFGRVVEDKGFDLALEALPAVLREFPNARLVVAGDGVARASLEEQAVRMGIDRNVSFIGWVDPSGIPDLINSATLVVVPSRWEEAFGLVALEAAQMARPVVGTRVGGLPEVVVDGETGLVVAKEDPVALARAIIRLLTDPQRATAMGQSARRRALERFGWERFLTDYDALYRRLMVGTAKDDAHERP
jgi:glycogen(starch) synthase